MKKGEIAWDTVGKLLLGLLLLIVVILIIFYIKTKLYGGDDTLLSTFSRFLRFGR